MRYGYCRTSKPKQSIERQIRNIKAAYQPIIQNGPPAAELRLASFKMIDRSHV